MRTLGWIVAALISASPSVVHAQSFTLRGYAVHDADGRVIEHVAVSATRLDDRTSPASTWETVTNDFGYFQLSLPSGRYALTIVLPSDDQQTLEAIPDEVRVEPSLLNTITLRLRLRMHTQSVTVTQSQEPAPDASGHFDQNDIQGLPQWHGRNIQSLLAYVPGVVFTDSVGTLAQFTAVGQRRFSNRLTVDGIAADLGLDVRGRGIREAASGALPALSTSGGTQAIVPLAAIEEIRVHTVNSPAELSRTPGAQTSVVTRAGSEHFLGTLFGDWRPQKLTAADWFEKARQAPLRQNAASTFGGTIGGPLLGRLRGIVAWERQAISRDVTTTIDVPSVMARESAPAPLRELLNAYPLPTGPARGYLASYTGRFPVRSQLWTVSPRLDGTVRSQRLFLRFAHGVSSGDALAAGAPQSPFLTYRNQEATALTPMTIGWTGSLGGSVSHDFRANVTRHHGAQRADATPSGGARPMDVSALASTAPADTVILARLFPGPSGMIATGRFADSTQTQVQFAETFTLVAGRHLLRLGIDALQVTTSSQPAPERFDYRYANLDVLISGRSAQAEISHVESARMLRRMFAMSIEDTWRAGSRLSMDLGIRYSITPAPLSANNIQPALLDYARLPVISPVQPKELWLTDRRGYSPRVGLSYQARTDDATAAVLRAGWTSISDEMTSPGGVAIGRGTPYISSRQILVAPSLSVQPTPPGTSVMPEYFAFPTRLRRPRTTEWYVGLEQRLARTNTLGVMYVGTMGRNLVYWHSYPNETGQMAIHAYSNDGTSSYHGLLANYTHRSSARWQSRVSYTWSHAIDLDSGEQPAPNAPPGWISPASNKASADFDRRHVLTATFNYVFSTPGSRRTKPGLLVDGWSLAATVTARSGTPFSVTYPREVENGSYVLRLDRAADVPLWIHDSTVPSGQRLNPDAFLIPEGTRQGAFGRNALTGRGLCQLDLSLSRAFRIGRFASSIRLDAFNILNRLNSGPPSGKFGESQFGRPNESYADALGQGTLSGGGLPPLQQIGGPRSVQLAVSTSF